MFFHYLQDLADRIVFLLLLSRKMCKLSYLCEMHVINECRLHFERVTTRNSIWPSDVPEINCAMLFDLSDNRKIDVIFQIVIH